MPGAYPGYPPQGYPGYPPPGYPPPGYPPVDGTHPVEAPAPDFDEDPIPEPSFDLEEPEDDTEENLHPLSAGIDALFEDDDDEDEIEIEEVAPPPAAPVEEGGIPGEITPADDPDLTDDDLDALFDEEDAAEGISSMVEHSTEDIGTDDPSSIDDIPEPDPLPQSLTANIDDDEEEDAPTSRRGRKAKTKKKKKGGVGLIVAVVVVLLLGGLGAGMFFMRDMVLQYVPALGMVYDMAGLSPALGNGLEIRNVNSERGTGEGGIDFLMLSGNVTNVAEESKPVPLIKALLIDAEGEIIQSVVQEPGATEIPAGEVLGFAVKIEEPSPLARRLEVTFEPRPQPE